jgi:hypothetical protein
VGCHLRRKVVEFAGSREAVNPRFVRFEFHSARQARRLWKKATESDPGGHIKDTITLSSLAIRAFGSDLVGSTAYFIGKD